MWDSLTGAFNGVMNLLDLPGSSMRDLVAGENPWDQWSSPLSADHRVSGAQLVSMYAGSDPNSLATTIGGIGAEMLLDPTNLLGGAGVLRRVMAARKAVQANKAIDVANDARQGLYGLVNSEAVNRVRPAVSPVAAEVPQGVRGYLPDYSGDNITLHHASPHKWAAEPGFPYGRPRLDKVGTGEGAQVYGHGIYAAENPAVVDDYYMHTLKRDIPNPGVQEEAANEFSQLASSYLEDANALKDPLIREDYIKWVMSQEKPGSSLSRRKIAQQIEGTLFKLKASPPYGPDAFHQLRGLYQEMAYGPLAAHVRSAGTTNFNRVQELADSMSSPAAYTRVTPTRYELTMPKETHARLMSWETPLADQPQAKHLWDAIQKDAPDYLDDLNLDTNLEYHTGRDWIKKILPRAVDDVSLPGVDIYNVSDTAEWVSQYLQGKGIPGTRYFDSYSKRGGPRATSNVVVWDQDVLDRVKPRKINGQPVPLNDMAPLERRAVGTRARSSDPAMAPSFSSPLSPYHEVPSAMRQLQALAAYNVGVRDRGVTLE